MPPDVPGLRGVRRRDGRGAVCAYEYEAAGHSWIHVPGVATYRLDGATRVIGVAEPGAPPGSVHGTFSRMVIPATLQFLGLEVLHASAVLAPRGVVPMCAVSGTGKSTLAYGLSRRGYRLWADDAVYLQPGGRHALAVPVPFRPRLERSAAAFFGEGAAELRLDSIAAVVQPAPVRALCVLVRRMDGDVVRSAQLAPATAFRAVLAHAHDFGLENPARKRRLVRSYLDLTSGVPVYELSFRGHLPDLPAVLDHVERLLAD